MGKILTGDQLRIVDRRLGEILRQLGQDSGYPHDPDGLCEALQLVGEGKFKGLKFAKKFYEAIQRLGGNQGDLLEFIDQPGLVEKIAVFFMHQLYKPQTVDCCLDGDYFTSIPDVEVPEQFQSILVKYRTIARAWGIADSVAVCYRVRAGFTLKKHAPKFGKCEGDFEYLKNWKFVDEPTLDCYTFWIPCIVPDSMNKTYDEQLRLLAEIRVKYELPTHHLTNIGTVAENAGLILAHKKATGLLIPLGGKWIRTATSDEDGYRLSLGDHDASGLLCYYWYSGGSRRVILGVFARGVEILGR